MISRALWLALPFASALAACTADDPVRDGAAPLEAAHQDGGSIHRVKHVIVVMQENHSFDNYFGALAYAPGSPYHVPRQTGRHDDDGDGDRDDRRGCRPADHDCVDGLGCSVDAAGAFQCTNTNLDDDGSIVHAFHDTNRCVQPDLDHGWASTHREANFDHPNDTRRHAPMSGFVRVNDETEQHDHGSESATDDETMGFYTQDEIPFYYDLANRFALSDRFFSSVLGPTFPNRSYLLAATSFGHLTTNDSFPPPGGYRPITGTIFDLLEQSGVSWADYFQDAPQGGSFRPFSATAIDPHFFPVPVFLAQAAGAPGAGELPVVSFVDPNFGLFGITSENDEHPPTDIQRGQAFVSKVVNAVRSGPFWNDSVIFLVYDEHGGAYDHVPPPRAAEPDGIHPGQCADLSNPPASLAPGGGAECHDNLLGGATSVEDAIELCPALTADPTGPFPRTCARFDQLGVRVPFLVISPFSKPHYVSHEVADHTSILAFIESAFLSGQHLTERDKHAYDLRDLFDFAHSPSRDTPVGLALPPVVDCTPVH
ncbi:MAG TPA: alkaline phosphatase family protein [Kofleriaceae bacterium]|jgi:phospholipase C|nr:alkaline phosphatase family protein [Kofleriaceae bacterium]